MAERPAPWLTGRLHGRAAGTAAERPAPRPSGRHRGRAAGSTGGRPRPAAERPAPATTRSRRSRGHAPPAPVARRDLSKLGHAMTETVPERTGAEEVRWDLTELYASPEDPAIERTLAEGLQFAQDFERRYKGRLADLAPAEFVQMMEELGLHLQATARPAIYTHLLHSLDTRDPAAGRLMARIR